MEIKGIVCGEVLFSKCKSLIVSYLLVYVHTRDLLQFWIEDQG